MIDEEVAEESKICLVEESHGSSVDLINKEDFLKFVQLNSIEVKPAEPKILKKESRGPINFVRQNLQKP